MQRKQLFERTREARKIQGITVADLSRRTSIDRRTIDLFENGKRDIGVSAFENIMQASHLELAFRVAPNCWRDLVICGAPDLTPERFPLDGTEGVAAAHTGTPPDEGQATQAPSREMLVKTLQLCLFDFVTNPQLSHRGIRRVQLELVFYAVKHGRKRLGSKIDRWRRAQRFWVHGTSPTFKRYIGETIRKVQTYLPDDPPRQTQRYERPVDLHLTYT